MKIDFRFLKRERYVLKSFSDNKITSTRNLILMILRLMVANLVFDLDG